METVQKQVKELMEMQDLKRSMQKQPQGGNKAKIYILEVQNEEIEDILDNPDIMRMKNFLKSLLKSNRERIEHLKRVSGAL